MNDLYERIQAVGRQVTDLMSEGGLDARVQAALLAAKREINHALRAAR